MKSPHDGTGSGQTTIQAGGKTYNKWNPGQKWAYFKNMPHGLTQFAGGGLRLNTSSKGGWVRVGGDMWNKIHQWNATLAAHGGGTAVKGDGSAVRVKAFTPNGTKTGAWNPEIPPKLLPKTPGSGTGLASGTGVHGTGPKSNGGKQPGDPGYVPPGKGPNDQTNPGLHPPKTKNNTDAFSSFIGNPNTQSMIPLADAAAQAGLQYDGQIHDTRVQQADQTAQAAQNLADIQHWYSHIQSLNAAAQQGNDQAVSQQTAGNQGDMLAGLAAIGGGSNAHAGQALSQGLQANQFARQLGANQDNFYANMATQLGVNQAEQSSAQGALDSQRSQSLDSQLQDLLGQRGQALTTDQMAILSANNASRQGNFGNRISKLQSVLGAQQLGLNQLVTKAQLASVPKTGAHGFIPFSGQTPTQQQATLSLLLQGGKDAQGHSIAIPLVLAQARAKAMGYDAATGSNLYNILRTYTQ